MVLHLQSSPQEQTYLPFTLTIFTGLPQPHLLGSALVLSQVQSAPHRQNTAASFSISRKCIAARLDPHVHFPAVLAMVLHVQSSLQLQT